MRTWLPLQEQYLLVRELGSMLNQKNIHVPVVRCRRNFFIFFDVQEYKKKTMGRLNSIKLKTIFRNISCIVIIGMMKSGGKV